LGIGRKGLQISFELKMIYMGEARNVPKGMKVEE
jgi:hypothetical protein